MLTPITTGTEFTRNSAEGPYLGRVLRPHRTLGYWETVIVQGGHPALIGSIQVVSQADIRQALTEVA